MSLKVARMATQQRSIPLTKLSCLAGLGLISASQFAVGQENLLRDTLPPPAVTIARDTSESSEKLTPGLRLTKVSTISRQQESVQPPQLPTIIPEGQDVTSLKPDSEAGQTPKPDVAKTKREPLVLPPLGTPNISVQGVGTGATPEDMVSGRLPPVVNLPFGEERYGYWSLGYKTWLAPVYCHQPTYFEDVMLERHGHERCPTLQPLLSGVRFFGDVALMPYNSYLNPPLRDISSAGYYRPGSSAPGIRQRPTYDKGALRFQLLTTGTAVMVGQVP